MQETEDGGTEKITPAMQPSCGMERKGGMAGVVGVRPMMLERAYFSGLLPSSVVVTAPMRASMLSLVGASLCTMN